MKNTKSFFFVSFFLLTISGCGREEDLVSNESLLSENEVVVENVQNNEDIQSDKVGGPGFTWTHGDWSFRVLWEARYALSQSANGISKLPISNVPGNNLGWYGDWDYPAKDLKALEQSKAEASGVVGSLGPDAYGHFRGGWCTFFVRLVLYRSSYWAGYNDHLVPPGFPLSVYTVTPSMTNNYSLVKPGWVFASKSAVHMAIADSRATVDGKIGWWIIDANYVGGGNGYFVIGKHFMSDAKLLSNGYLGWLPDWASSNT